MNNPTIVLVAALIFVWMAIPKNASSKKSGGKKINIPFGKIWTALTWIFGWPFKLAALITGIFTKKKWIQYIVGAVVLILAYLCFFFWLRSNVPAVAAMMPWEKNPNGWSFQRWGFFYLFTLSTIDITFLFSSNSSFNNCSTLSFVTCLYSSRYSKLFIPLK